MEAVTCGLLSVTEQEAAGVRGKRPAGGQDRLIRAGIYFYLTPSGALPQSVRMLLRFIIRVGDTV